MLSIQSEPFDPGAELNAFIAATDGAGAAVTFTGIMRSTPDDPVSAMTIEHYPELARAEIERIMSRAMEQFSLLDVRVIHRFGRLLPGEPIMQVMTLAPHRRAAFEAAEYLMDYLKTDAPFWKLEERPSGASWVESKASDEGARAARIPIQSTS
ncbi:MAG: molybdenum cofactor biosynthesis protein MoaE [Devosia sp. 67-54]|uniref:molybdenum cofactor biosynthesis protein MoaE n=1 Tax=unclassified Devosia TaxID=196773 RepID=UPI00095C5E03|nr:MAG: molybdenum cofactor biosynthesis protein MoaE [Devosia sp. 67-54]